MLLINNMLLIYSLNLETKSKHILFQKTDLIQSARQGNTYSSGVQVVTLDFPKNFQYQYLFLD